MSVDMRVSYVQSLGDWRAWLGMAAFLLYGLFALRLLLRGESLGLIGFALLFPWLQFLLEFSSVRVHEIFVLYRSYLWMPGMMLLIALIVTRWPVKRSMIALAAVALLLVPLTVNRLWVFADNYRLWNDAANLLHSEVEAGADRIFFNRAQASVAVKEWDKAIADYQRALVVSPNLLPVRNELGMAYINSGNYREAQAQFDIAIRLKPDDGQAYYGKGLAKMGLQESREATRLFAQACALNIRMGCIMEGWRKKN
jgi:tetratricopeptide (TPR) repeat protein